MQGRSFPTPIKLGGKTTCDQASNLVVRLVDAWCGQYFMIPFGTSELSLEIFIHIHGDVLKVCPEAIPLRIASRLIPIHDRLRLSLY